MSYILTGVQHTKTGDVAMQTQGYETLDAAKHDFNNEWNYTYDNPDRLGLDTIIFDNAGTIVLNDHYVKNNESAQEAKSSDKDTKTE